MLDQLKYPVVRLRRRISPESLREVGVLFILRPETGLAREEVAVLKEWVDEGHGLVVVPGWPSERPTIFAERSHDDALRDDWFEDWFAWNGPRAKPDAFQPIERRRRWGRSRRAMR